MVAHRQFWLKMITGFGAALADILPLSSKLRDHYRKDLILAQIKAYRRSATLDTGFEWSALL